MKQIDRVKKILSDHRNEIRQEHKIRKMGIFGSYVRGEQKKKSDIDILVEFDEPVSLLDWVGAENYLTDILGIKVDLVPREDVRPELKKRIFKEVVYV